MNITIYGTDESNKLVQKIKAKLSKIPHRCSDNTLLSTLQCKITTGLITSLPDIAAYIGVKVPGRDYTYDYLSAVYSPGTNSILFAIGEKTIHNTSTLTVCHEYGHSVYLNIVASAPEILGEWESIHRMAFRGLGRPIWALWNAGYFYNSPSEYFAESFKQYVDYTWVRLVSPGVKKFLEKYIT